jgi:hypothetical protein
MKRKAYEALQLRSFLNIKVANGDFFIIQITRKNINNIRTKNRMDYHNAAVALQSLLH